MRFNKARQKRRAKKCASIDIIFPANMPTATAKAAALLPNGYNEKRLIESLREIFLLADVYVSIRAETDTQTRLLFQQHYSQKSSHQLHMYRLVVGRPTDID